MNLTQANIPQVLLQRLMMYWDLKECQIRYSFCISRSVWNIIRRSSVMLRWHSISWKDWIWRPSLVWTSTISTIVDILQRNWTISPCRMVGQTSIIHRRCTGRKKLTWPTIRLGQNIAWMQWQVFLGRNVPIGITEVIRKVSSMTSSKTTTWVLVHFLILRNPLGTVGRWTPTSCVSLILTRTVTLLLLQVV